MKKKIIGGLIVLIGIALLGGAVYVYFYTDLIVKRSGEVDTSIETKKYDGQDDIDKTPTGTVKPVVKRVGGGSDNDKIKVDPVVPERTEPGIVTQNDLESISSSFAERFGSYSNQSNFSNLTDLTMFMGEKMRKWADSYIDEHRKESSGSDIYYGIITKAISTETIKYDDELGVVEILVHTRRRESIGASSNSTNAFNQSITITFGKERGAWKVYSAMWEDR